MNGSVARDPRLWAVLGLVAVAALFAWEIRSGTEFVVDDSFITFSFSKNLARGAGPIYGHGLRVEGYSNFLWMALLAIPLAFAPHGDPVFLARAMAVPFVGLLLASTYLLARARASRPVSFAATLLVAADSDVLLAFLSGLETLPYTALLLAAFASYVHADRSPLARRLTIPILTAVALMRIDGFIPAGFVILFELGAAWSDRRLSFRAFARWAAPAVGVWSAWFAWRFWYYGLPLPSTYYAKALIPELMPRRGTEYVYDELAANGLFLALPAFGYLLWRRQRPALLIGLFALVQVVYAARVGGDWMPNARFLLPAVPLFIVLLAWAAEGLIESAKRRGPLATLAACGAAVAGLMFIGTRVEPHLSVVPHQRAKLAFASQSDRHVQALKKAAAFLSLVVPPGGRLVTDYGGVLAYYTEATPIEMWGLCNATIATRGNTERVLPVYGRTCPECYPELDPEFFHVGLPIVRKRDSFARHSDVVRSVWQTDTIGRYLDFTRGFVSGRIVNLRTGKAVWFLERARGTWQPRVRSPAPGMIIEYPFVAGGLAPG
jgi:arabinofuranosyltransferase